MNSNVILFAFSFVAGTGFILTSGNVVASAPLGAAIAFVFPLIVIIALALYRGLGNVGGRY